MVEAARRGELTARPDPDLIKADKDFESVRTDIKLGDVFDLMDETSNVLSAWSAATDAESCLPGRLSDSECARPRSG